MKKNGWREEVFSRKNDQTYAIWVRVEAWMVTNPEKGGLQRQGTGICFQGTFEPLR